MLLAILNFVITWLILSFVFPCAQGLTLNSQNATEYLLPPDYCKDKYPNCPGSIRNCLEPQTQTDCAQTCHFCKECYDYNEEECKEGQMNPDICLNEPKEQDCQLTCHMCDLKCRDELASDWCEYFNRTKPDSCKNPYMKKVCKLTCGLCSPACVDILQDTVCSKFSEENKCDLPYAQSYCRKTCTNCKYCKNLRDDCRENIHRCNETFFKTNCRSACGYCNP